MSNESPSGIAIISMVGRFPGAADVDSFWELVRDGHEGISFFTAEELIESGISPKLVNNPNYVRARGMLPDIERFDARFFGYSPREAEIIDPQQRLFLESCWTAMESAGYAAARPPAPVGVFAGCIGGNTYLLNNLLGDQELRENVGDYPLFIANDKDSLATRAAYKLNLRGPALTIQTACSTSLVAVAMACQSLIDFQCDMALAGGAAITVPQKLGYLYTPGMVVSPDGHCRAFDANAKGTLVSSGIGVVLLKRVEEALRDRDPIIAVIRGWAVNNDGADKVGYSAPSVQGQADCITQALATADIDADTIGMVEAHGTGTPVGDPIEVAALTQAFRTSTKRRGFCALGSVKSNLGHLETAAGIASLIKTALSIQHAQIPPSLHFQTPNPEIDFASSPFFVNTQLRAWPAGPHGRRAGVSSLGIGGTNAHVIMEQAPPLPDSDAGRPWKLLVLSARTSTALETATDNLKRHLQQHPEQDLADVAYTLQVGRRPFNHRRIVVCTDHADAIAALESRDPQRVFTGEVEKPPGMVFMFSGQGSQHVNMCRELYQREPFFREQIDLCVNHLRTELHYDLRSVLFPPDAQREHAAAQLTQTSITQPALFVIEYALAKYWMELGLQPVAMIGHSLGEYVAACLAGVMSLRDALALIVQRGWLMQQMAPGAMLAVPVSEEQVRQFLTTDLSLSVINGPSHCVVAGPIPAIDALEQRLAEKKLRGRRLQTSHAFHSAMMDSILDAFTMAVRRVQLSPPRIRYISNLTGRWITPQEATDPAYYSRQLRGTVRFAPGLELLLGESDRALLEVGPGATLSILARQHPDPSTQRLILSSLRGDGAQSDIDCVLSTLGRLWLAGCPVSWEALYSHERRRRIPLPTYPFERERFWIEPVRKTAEVPAVQKPRPTPTQQAPDIERYFYKQSWFSAPLPAAAVSREQQSWLLLINDHPLCMFVARRLRQQGHAVTAVRVGAGLAHDRLNEYSIAPTQADNHERVLEEMRRQGQTPRRIVHMWNIGGDGIEPTVAELGAAQDLAYFSITSLAQAIGRQIQSDPLLLAVVTSGACRVDPEETLHRPDRALVSGPCKVIPAEYRNITCQHVDLDLSASSGLDEEALAERLIAEWSAVKPEPAVAYRGLQRFVLTHRSIRLPRPSGELPRLRHGGAYLITGGLGGIGLALAEYLARSYRARLLLTSRHGMPQGSELMRAPEGTGEQNREALHRRMIQIESLKRLGAKVMVARADVSDLQAMQEAVDAAVARFGPIRGVIHAAGVPSGGVIQRRSRAENEAVLAPKVKGTMVLDTIFRTRDLDFFVLCSSLSSVLGGFGQADYSAANSFLDAFAHHRSARSRGLTAAVNWDAWREVGMAVNSARQRSVAEQRTSQLASNNSQYREIAHPLFDSFMLDDKQAEIYVARLGVPRSWVLNEHRLQGRPTLPGTAYLELARAAYELHLPEVRTVELRDVTFLSPLTVADGQERAVRVVLRRQGTGPECEFSILSRPDAERDYWQEHARGRIAPLPPAPVVQHDIARLQRETPLVWNEAQSGAAAPKRPIEFGSRWQNLEQIQFGRNQGLASIRLPDVFLADLDMFMLHPALLDSATGFVSVRTSTPFLPFSYRRVRILRPPRQSLYSYAAFEQVNEGGRDRLHINLTVMDKSGVVLLEIEDYVLVKVSS